MDAHASGDTYALMDSFQRIDPNAAQDCMDELCTLSGSPTVGASVLSSRDTSPNVLEHGANPDPGPPLFDDVVMLDAGPSFLTTAGRVASTGRTARKSAKTLVDDKDFGTMDTFFDSDTAVEGFHSANEESVEARRGIDASTDMTKVADTTEGSEKQKRIDLPKWRSLEAATAPVGVLDSVANRGTQGRLRLFSPHYVARKLFGPSSNTIDVELGNPGMEFIVNEASTPRSGSQPYPSFSREGKVAALAGGGAIFIGSVVYLAMRLHEGDSVFLPCIMMATSVVVIGGRYGIDRAATLRTSNGQLFRLE